MNKIITIGIVEDDSIYRQSLVNTINSDPRFKVIWNLATGLDAIHAIQNKDVPDIILMDIYLGDQKMDGIETAYYIWEINNNIKVIVLTHSENVEDINRSIVEGKTRCYLHKEDLIDRKFDIVMKGILKDELIESILQVYCGNFCISNKIKEKWVNFLQHGGINMDKLSNAQKIVWEMRSKGVKIKDIAFKLDISESTVKEYIRRIKEKCNKTQHVI